MIRAFLIAGLLSIAVPAHAQVAPEVCQAVWDRAMGLVPDGTARAEIEADGPDCVARNAVLLDGAGAGEIAADVIRWSGQGLEDFASDLVPPRALILTAEGLSLLTLTGEPTYDYVNRARQVQKKVTLHFEARWDELTGRFVLDVLDIDFPGENQIRIVARAEGADLSSLPAMAASFVNLSVTELTIDVTSNGLFENVALEPILRSMARVGQAPEEAMARLVDEALGAVASVPDDLLSGPSKEALAAFLPTLPAPQGALRLSVAADPPLNLRSGLAARMLPGLSPEARFQGLGVTILYEPTAEVP